MADPTADRVQVERNAGESATAFSALRSVRRGVAVFGSARDATARRWGSFAEDVASRLTNAGFTFITGSGPGLMAAANAAATAAGGHSVGLTFELPQVDPANRHCTHEVHFHYFFLRKLAFVTYSCAFVIPPGGYGTLDERFEAINLRRTQRLAPFPIILVGDTFWGGLVEWLRTEGVRSGVLDREEVDSLLVNNDPEVVTQEVVACHRILCRRPGIYP